MKLENDERLTIEQIRNVSKLNFSDINDFFKGLMMVTVMNYSEGESTKIPYFGELKIDYNGDEIKDEGRVAKLNVVFTPANALKRNIGQLIDVNNPKCDTKITDVDCIKEIMCDVYKKLNEIMMKEN